MSAPTHEGFLNAIEDAGVEYGRACVDASHDLADGVERRAAVEARASFLAATEALRAQLTVSRTDESHA